MPACCSYIGCNNSRVNTPGLKLYRFPKDESSKEWIRRCGNSSLVEMSGVRLRSRLLCQQHFPPDRILPSGRLLLATLPYHWDRIKLENHDCMDDRGLPAGPASTDADSAGGEKGVDGVSGSMSEALDGVADVVKSEPDDIKVSSDADSTLENCKASLGTEEKQDGIDSGPGDGENKTDLVRERSDDAAAQACPDDMKVDSSGVRETSKDVEKSDVQVSKSPVWVNRTASIESEERSVSGTSAAGDPLDEDSSNSASFQKNLEKVICGQASKRRRSVDSEKDQELTDSGSKRIRIEKKHCSDGEQEVEIQPCPSPRPKSERRRSHSESDMIKDLDHFNRNKKISDVLKVDKWKPPELTPGEMIRLKQTNVREQKMRENVLNVIRRNYSNLSVEDFEDAIYVAMMDYFCHYNASTLLQRKVLMLERLVTKIQENYNRTLKQFSETKFLLRRMVELRKNELKKCTCKDRIPFKLIRSVAVQVQTAKCRGGDLCPGSGVGLDPNFKDAESTKNNTTKKVDDQSRPASTGSTNPSSPGSSGVKSNQISPQSPPVIERKRHISVSVPPGVAMRVPRAKHISDSCANKTVVTNASPAQLASRQKRTAPSAASSPTVTPKSPDNIKIGQPPSNMNALVIDLTDKDEDVPNGGNPKPPVPQTVTQTQAQPVQIKPPVTVQNPVKKLIKTSVLSTILQLPPLPAAPSYPPVVRRPPQPVLKVCKADQSGIMLSWTLRSNVPLANEIILYQVYACQENSGVTREWSTVGDVKALPLPMACTLSQFREGHRYHFVVRAVDKLQVFGEFSHPASILLVSRNGTAPNHAVADAPANRR